MSQTKAQLIDTLVASLLPASDSAVDIGSNAVRFANIYGDTLYGNGANLTGINTDLVADTSPQLGGNLDVNTKNILFGDSSDGASDDVLIFGAGSDLKIYHDGSNSRIVESGTGSLVIQTTRLNVANAADSEGMLQAYQDGAVELYYDNSKKFETTSIGWKSEDSVKGIFGTGGDAQIFHNGSNFFIKKISAGTGNFYLDSEGSSDLYLRNGDGGTGTNIAIRCYSNAGVDLRYQSTKKFETTSAGGTIAGALTTNNGGGNAVLGSHLDLGDNQKVRCGASDDLQIYHDGTNSLIANTTGNLYILDDNAVILGSNSGTESYFKGVKDGAVELYHDNSKKFETASYGAVVTGTFQATGNIEVFDNGKLNIGTGADLQIYHDGSHSRIVDAGTGNLILQSDRLEVTNAAGTTNMINAYQSAQVELYYNTNKKFETTNTGIQVTGQVDARRGLFTDDGSGAPILGVLTDDESPWAFVINNSTSSNNYEYGLKWYVNNSGNGIHQIKGASAYKTLAFATSNGSSSDNAILIDTNRSVKLYYQGNQKLETISSGIDVDGTITCNDLITAGAVLHENDTNTLMHFDQADNIAFKTNGTVRFRIANGANTSSSDLLPSVNNGKDLGSSSVRWRNIYTNDLNLSNEGSTNDVDGTWGNFTIQEGEDDLFLINKRNGKKYKFNLTEVS